MRVSKNLPDHLAPIVETIVRGYQPEKIILFGSLVSGRGHRARDIDLLVIKRTKKNPWERLAELDRWLDHRIPTDVLGYTPTEVARYVGSGDDFLGTVMRRGRVVYEKAS